MTTNTVDTYLSKVRDTKDTEWLREERKRVIQFMTDYGFSKDGEETEKLLYSRLKELLPQDETSWTEEVHTQNARLILSAFALKGGDHL